MCLSAPDVPQTVERQSAKAPDKGAAADRVDDGRKRRMAYAASILTSPQGVMGAPKTTATMPAVTGA
ncbi:MAG: hypothetical protein ACRCYS_05000 [Beijerinckiaceae bacterium]